MKYLPKEIAYLRNMYSTEQRHIIMENLEGHTWVSIKHKAKNLGLSRPRTIRRTRLHVLLEESVENAYWWGLIYSDGHLSPNDSLVIQLSDIDRDHLELIANKLETVVRRVKGNMSRVDVMDKASVRLLREILKMNHRKTYNPPSDLNFLTRPDTLLAFFVGFSDGDGSLHFDENGTFKSLKISVHGSWLDVLEIISRRLDEEWGINTTVTTNGRGNACLYMGTKASHQRIISFIETHQLPALRRKWYNKGKGFNTNEHHNDYRA